MKPNTKQKPTEEIDDKQLELEIRQMARKQIKWLLSQEDTMLLKHEMELKHSILRSMAPNLFPKLAADTEIPEEETKLTAEEQEHLNKILDG